MRCYELQCVEIIANCFYLLIGHIGKLGSGQSFLLLHIMARVGASSHGYLILPLSERVTHLLVYTFVRCIKMLHASM